MYGIHPFLSAGGERADERDIDVRKVKNRETEVETQ